MPKLKPRSLVAGMLLFSSPLQPLSNLEGDPAVRPFPEDGKQEQQSLYKKDRVLPCGVDPQENPGAVELPRILANIGLSCVDVSEVVADELSANLIVTRDGKTATGFTLTDTPSGTEIQGSIVAPVDLVVDQREIDLERLYSDDVQHIDICAFWHTIQSPDLSGLGKALTFLAVATDQNCWS